MASETSPAFQFYVKDWRSSRSIMRMTFAQRGMYLEMLLEQWESLSLPDDPDAVADLLGGTRSEWRRAWDTLRRKFVSLDDGRIQNLKLEEVRASLTKYKSKRSDAGKLGAERRWQTDGKPMAEPSKSHRSPLAPDSSSSSSSTASAIAIATASAIATIPRATKSGRNYGRIFLHRWQVDALIDTLGSHAAGFGLDEWLDGLSRAAAERVMPKADVWPWVQAELTREIQQRGLPVVQVAAPPSNKRIAGLMAGGEAFLKRVQS